MSGIASRWQRRRPGSRSPLKFAASPWGCLSRLLLLDDYILPILLIVNTIVNYMSPPCRAGGPGSPPSVRRRTHGHLAFLLTTAGELEHSPTVLVQYNS